MLHCVVSLRITCPRHSCLGLCAPGLSVWSLGLKVQAGKNELSPNHHHTVNPKPYTPSSNSSKDEL